MMNGVDLRNGNCIELLEEVPDNSVDCIIDDLPYGVLNKGNEGAKWDCEIPLEPLWKQFLRVAKDNAAIILFGQGMFSARLMMSQPSLWRYNLIWCKDTRVSGFLNANRMPLRNHEDILVFYRKQPTYNPQMEKRAEGDVVHTRGRLLNVTNNCYGKRKEMPSRQINERFPRSVLTFLPPHLGLHPTEKPVELLRWLIRSYSNIGETVLDATMGSGSTGVASVLEDRGFVGIEKDEQFFSIAKSRIEKTMAVPQQLYLAI